MKVAYFGQYRISQSRHLGRRESASRSGLQASKFLAGRYVEIINPAGRDNAVGCGSGRSAVAYRDVSRLRIGRNPYAARLFAKRRRSLRRSRHSERMNRANAALHGYARRLIPEACP